MDDALITERRPVSCPQVFGYVRHVTGGLARHTALVDCLSDYCRRHELTLCGVFTDRNATLTIRSPAFVGLLDALELPYTYGALIPSLNHLGPKRIALERKRQIAATNTQLIILRSPRTAPGRVRSFNAGHDLQQQGGT
ncbi:hypothetical protein [Streptomyces griseiscabiei]|uniref:Resolvase/invertase-type recombinase catalytic domain-containing protein n=1 Tax=Streptomyces griseiscabiei TaxID=2993540 RepID=A0ABU4L7Z2_9ACTN|nr:hypothetical protein [Streptomyces griseiscabiei]MDX2911856.1 hypothetical protein [Streptomyces griseiscabiei]